MTSLNMTDAALTAAEPAIAGETLEDNAPVISRRLIDDPIDPTGPPCVALIDADTGVPVRIVNESHDDYEVEVALAEQEQRETRNGIRDSFVRSAYARELLAEAAAVAAIKDRPPGTPASRFTPRVPDLNGPRPRWLIKNLVPERGQAMIYGRHGTGKSTLAMEMGVDVALGKPWHGRKTKQGTVIYIASEDAHGLRARLDALLRDRGITLDDLGGRFLELTGRPHLLKPDEVQELIKELKPLNPSLIIVDTLARAAAGADENSAQEMGVMIENCQTLINQTGATVCYCHHTGKDASKGARGSSAIPGAVDAEIFLERPDETENLRIAHVGKMRGGRDYYTLFRYGLEMVQLGVDEDGDKITSTVVREIAPDPAGTVPVTKLPDTPVRRAIRGVLSDAMRAMPFDELVSKAAMTLAPPDQGQDDNRRKRVRQAYERMVQDKELHMSEDGMVSPLDPAMPFTPVQADDHSDLTTGGAT
jgi:AAA domain